MAVHCNNEQQNVCYPLLQAKNHCKYELSGHSQVLYFRQPKYVKYQRQLKVGRR